jgi:integrase/recombinase XerC
VNAWGSRLDNAWTVPANVVPMTKYGANQKQLTLTHHAETYLRGRRLRGEITLDTLRNQRCHLAGLATSFGARPITRFGPAAIDRWLETIGHLTPATRRSRISTVRTFCRWMVAQRRIGADPTGHLEPVRQPRAVPRALEEPRVAAVLDACPDLRARAIVWLMVGLGLRCCEVARLEVQDYEPHAGLVTVTGKGGHERALPVPAEAAAAVDAYLAEAGVVGGPLIRSYRRPSEPLRADTISGLVGEWMAEAGIKHRQRDGVSAHALRHTAASDVLDRCGDIRVVQQMLGHAHLATTAIYLRRARLDQLREAMEGRAYRPQVA